MFVERNDDYYYYTNNTVNKGFNGRYLSKNNKCKRRFLVLGVRQVLKGTRFVCIFLCISGRKVPNGILITGCLP